MNAADLRALQAPLKQRYRDDATSALVTLEAEGRVGGDAITCTVPTWSGDAVAGLHPSAGGDGSEACSGDMLLQAVVACAGVTLRSVATAMGVPLAGARVVARGRFDARGTLGVSKETPVGLTDVTLSFELDTTADAATVQRLIQLTERYCVVFQTLANPPKLSVDHRVVSPAAG